MVERQLRPRGICDEVVLAAMASVPRELFVPRELADVAYSDEALPIRSGQTISQPYMVASMTELIEPRPGLRVLEVGTGSGYGAAILATCGCDVTSVERHAELAAAARDRLKQIGLAERVTIVVGDGSVGIPGERPFEAILVTAAAPAVPVALRAQLAEGGDAVEDPGELGVLVHVALHEQGAALGVEARGEQEHRRAAGGLGVLRVVPREGEAVEVDDAVERLVGRARALLGGHPVAYRPEVVAQMDLAGGLDAREHA